ncbi:regulator of chromosome condensation domain-containing protein [Cavenderia fasciculata]|uniref:Regulator of chromosome condensation domain-containing protein n=1 Tax=Cavenderia fasciculata TaxID=261658 RepID=F4PYQ6_CACFS|nr:regulator of chromosome condensation domain-containing protein [Cavenderia fasciculata]EGG19322.1 regulator of chromosome condensation domain-containing protein [Cavenderia fasciculata]|eukprot:XP_004357593.1 regulator of chromosome condensation domain-containing protein [Cavenderia fasciculata]
MSQQQQPEKRKGGGGFSQMGIMNLTHSPPVMLRNSTSGSSSSSNINISNNYNNNNHNSNNSSSSFISSSFVVGTLGSVMQQQQHQQQQQYGSLSTQQSSALDINNNNNNVGRGGGGNVGMLSSSSFTSTYDGIPSPIKSSSSSSSMSGGQGSNSSGGLGGGGASSNGIGSFTQNYELYSMNKLFCINTTGGGGGKSKEQQLPSGSSGIGGGRRGASRSDRSMTSSSSVDSSLNTSGGLLSNDMGPLGVTVLLEAQAGYDDHLFFAMFCSNDYLIFRYVGQSKVPQYKYIQWNRDPLKKIVAMSFDPTAQWLLCLSHDTSLVRIPIYFMMCKKINVLEEKTPQPIEKSDKLSSWVSSSRLFKNVSLGSLGGGGNNNNNNNSNNQQTKTIQSMVTIPPISTKGQIGSSCIWWKTSNSEDFGIISTQAGHIFFVNLSTNELQKKVKFEHPITKIDLINAGNETFIIISTKTNGYYQLLIEQKIKHQYDSIVTSTFGNNSSSSSNATITLVISGGNNNSNSQNGSNTNQSNNINQNGGSGGLATIQSPYQLVTPLFSSDRVLSDRTIETQSSQENGLVVTSFIKSTSKLEIYDYLYLDKFPLFVYQLPQTTTKFYFTKNITFLSEIDHHDDQARMNVSIISNLVSGTASNSKYMKNQSIIQTFSLAQGEFVLDIKNSLTVSSNDLLNGSGHLSPSNFNNINNTNTTASSSSSLNNSGKLNGSSGGNMSLSSSSSSPLSNSLAQYNNNNNNNNGPIQSTFLPSCYIWTNYAVYELRAKKTPEEIFFELLSKNLEKTDGEALGKTFRMDLLSLYETAADHAFEQSQYGRALDLYYLSGVKTKIGRMDIIMTHLKAVLHGSDAYSAHERKKLTNILFQCYLQRLLSSREEFKSLETEFTVFLTTNTDYDVIVALQNLMSNGLIDYYFIVAHSRKLVGKALTSLLENNRLHLDSQNISFLQSQYCQELKSNSNGMIFDCLPPDFQVKLILEDLGNVPRYLKRLYYLLPMVSEKTLIDIITLFDPITFEPFNLSQQQSTSGNNNNSNNNSNNNNNNSQASPNGIPTSPISKQNQQQQQQSQQHLNNNNSPKSSSGNLIGLEHYHSISSDVEPLPGRSSESIPVRNEEYFELYLTSLLLLLNHYKSKYGDQNFADLQRQKMMLENQKQQDKNSNSDDDDLDDEDNVVDQDLLVHPMPALRFNEKHAKSVSCGWEHAAVITVDGELFTWGNNTSGQLGHGLAAGKHQSTPMRVESLKQTPIMMMSLGGEHTVVIDRSFHIYSWGNGKYGQLGHGVSTPHNLPKRIEEFAGQKISSIATGYWHTLVLRSGGDLFAFGSNEHGQLGLNDLKHHLPIPTRVNTADIHHAGQPTRVTGIFCGHSHSVLRTSHGDVYSFGANAKGQLGHGSTESCRYPKLIQGLKGKNIKRITCGPYHTVVTTDLDSVYCWGQGEHMCLGTGSNKNELVPKLVELFVNKRVERVVCGLYHTATLTQPMGDSNTGGNVYICGSSEHGKLGIGGDPRSPSLDKAYPAIIPSINSANVVDLASGAEFNALITSNGALYMWGAGTHGQIGNGKNQDTWIPTRVSLSSEKNQNQFIVDESGSTITLSSSMLLTEKNNRYTQEGLEETLRKNANGYRPFVVINKAKQFGNWDAVATIYEVLEDYKSTLECRLLSLKQRNLDTDKQTHTLLQLAHKYIVNMNGNNETFNQQQKSNNATTSTNGGGSTLIQPSTSPSSNASTSPSNRLSPPINNAQEILPPQSNNKTTKENELDHQQIQQQKTQASEISKELLLLILNYWKEKQLPIEELENYIMANLEYFSLPLSNILSTFNSNSNSNKVDNTYPLVLNFSPLLYLNVVKYYLQLMKYLGEKERNHQRVSEKVLLTNIKENLQKDIQSRTKIQIQSLQMDMFTSPTTAAIVPNSSSVMRGGSADESYIEKDLAFTCNHFFSKRRYYSSILPQFQTDVQKLSIMSPTTLNHIIEEYNQKWVSLSCPVCLYNFLRELANDPLSKQWKV